MIKSVATFGSEYVAARTCTEQIIDLRNTLRYLGVPVEGSSYMFGDNETVVNTAATPHSRLHKRHVILSYHRVREAIAAGVTKFFHVKGKTNVADILSKHWDYPSIWPLLKPILFWKGDTGKLSQTPVSDTTKPDGNDDNGEIETKGNGNGTTPPVAAKTKTLGDDSQLHRGE